MSRRKRVSGFVCVSPDDKKKKIPYFNPDAFLGHAAQTAIGTDIAMSAGIFTNCSMGQAAQSLILSAIYSHYCLFYVPCSLRTAL